MFKPFSRQRLTSLLGLAVGGLMLVAAQGAVAAQPPGEGITVKPLKSSIAEETFQTLLVTRALEKLGYTVEDIKEIEYAAAQVAIGNGDATFLADHWDPLHIDFYLSAGGGSTSPRLLSVDYFYFCLPAE